MNRETLGRLGVPERALDKVLDAWNRDLMREAIRLAARTMKEQVDAMPREMGNAVQATLMALTPELAAKKARCCRKTIDRAIEAGEIIALRGSTGLVIIDRNSFDAWVQARTPILSKVV